MKNALKFVFCLLLVFMLASCTRQVGIGDKAIVKGVIVNLENNKYEVSIIVLTCKPSSQISEIKEEANVYTALGETMQEAISNAEKLQNKTPFYAQNELLFISEKAAAEKLFDISKYFLREDASRPSLSVFVTQKNADYFKSSAKILPDIIRSTERGDKFSSKEALKITQLKFNENNKFDGYLPQFTFKDEVDSFFGTEKIIVYKNSEKSFEIAKNDIIYLFLLNNKLNKLQLSAISSENISIRADGLLLSYHVDDNFNLKIFLTGNIRSIQENDADICDKKEAMKVAISANQAITEKCEKIIFDSFYKQNDIFNFAWWFEAEDKTRYEKLLKEDSLYQNGRIEFVSCLKII